MRDQKLYIMTLDDNTVHQLRAVVEESDDAKTIFFDCESFGTSRDFEFKPGKVIATVNEWLAEHATSARCLEPMGVLADHYWSKIKTEKTGEGKWLVKFGVRSIPGMILGGNGKFVIQDGGGQWKKTFRSKTSASTSMTNKWFAEQLASTIVNAIESDPQLKPCETFSELHDHCDANMLGDSRHAFDNYGVHIVRMAQELVEEMLPLS